MHACFWLSAGTLLYLICMPWQLASGPMHHAVSLLPPNKPCIRHIHTSTNTQPPTQPRACRWFDGFDWEGLAARKVAPPRKPRDDAAKRIRELAVGEGLARQALKGGRVGVGCIQNVAVCGFGRIWELAVGSGQHGPLLPALGPLVGVADVGLHVIRQRVRWHA